MGYFESLFLGLVQGSTEFLPVSSSGHLVILQKILDADNQVQFDIFLHLATLFAVLFFFKTDILEIIKGVLGKSRDGKKLLFGIIIGSIPTAIIGLLLNDFFKEKFSQPKIASAMLVLTGFILWFSSKFAGRLTDSEKNYLSAKPVDFLLIGFFQGIAIMPGISRSGITIAAALLLGFNRTWAFKYSMLLSIPAILGAGIMEIKNFTVTPVILSGGVIALLSGILALHILSKVVIAKKFHTFSYYLWPAGILGVLLL
ncbi:MAG: undecaprenyl-diphosphate phosphatase [Elusimicrobia bacterium]|nr:undecaprenyl-diphosphate phosphatase [Elusimicrobiota bacterium]